MRHKPIPIISQDVAVRFWSRVQHGPQDECWEYQRCQNAGGYGSVSLGGASNNLLANRVAWFLSRDVDPDDFQVLHSCDNPPCCNPSHLFLGTSADNRVDCVTKNRHSATLSPAAVAEIRNSPDTHHALAERFEVWPDTVGKIKRGDRWGHLGGPITTGHRKGTQRADAKLTEERVHEIRTSTETCVALATRFGCSDETVRKARLGQTWPHVKTTPKGKRCPR
jgi:hypothetical protein